MIRENVRDAVVTSEIEANDPDTTAKLTLSIDWSSSYATKLGLETERHFYVG